MSKKWTPELDSILLHCVFEECQVSFGKALCTKIAERVRSAGIDGFTECTPKAVENRLYSWKKKNVTTATGTPGDSPVSTPKKAAPRPKKEPSTPRTPRARKGVVKKKKAESEEAGDEDEMESPPKGRKRASESEEASEGKKVKIEPADAEEGDEGLDVGEVEEV